MPFICGFAYGGWLLVSAWGGSRRRWGRARRWSGVGAV